MQTEAVTTIPEPGDAPSASVAVKKRPPRTTAELNRRHEEFWAQPAQSPENIAATHLAASKVSSGAKCWIRVEPSAAIKLEESKESKDPAKSDGPNPTPVAINAARVQRIEDIFRERWGKTGKAIDPQKWIHLRHGARMLAAVWPEGQGTLPLRWAKAKRLGNPTNVRAEAVTHVVAHTYFLVTGKRPTRVNPVDPKAADADGRVSRGPFQDVLTLVFRELLLTASVEHYAVKECKAFVHPTKAQRRRSVRKKGEVPRADIDAHGESASWIPSFLLQTRSSD